MEDFEFGFTSQLWLSKAAILGAHPERLRHAVCDVMNYLWTTDEEVIDPTELFDRLVQIAVTGRYTPVELAQQEYEDVMQAADTILQEDADDLINKFREQLDEMDSDDNAG